jgi:16S rRNA processing protein RimM
MEKGLLSPIQKNMKTHRNSGFRQPELCYLAVGRTVRAHGLRGEVSMIVLTDFPERFETTEWLYLGNEFEAEPYRLKSYRWHKANILLTLEGITDRTQAEGLRGLLVQVPIDEAVPLPAGSYYLYQLIGLEVITTDNEPLGVVDSILETGANDVYIVKGGEKEILLPAIPDVVKSVDIEKGQMIVQILEGLI